MSVSLQDLLPFWSNLSQSQQQMFLSQSKIQSFDKGCTINRSEYQCKGALAITNGQIRAYIISPDGREVTLYRLFGGDICVLSASCVLDSIAFDVTVEAVENTTAFVIPSHIIKSVAEENPYVEAFLYKTATQRFSDVMWTMQQILFMGADKRVAIFLWDEFASNGGQDIKLTHDAIAKLIGSAREVVSKTLKSFEDNDIIRLQRGKISLLDKAKLKSLT